MRNRCHAFLTNNRLLALNFLPNTPFNNPFDLSTWMGSSLFIEGDLDLHGARAFISLTRTVMPVFCPGLPYTILFFLVGRWKCWLLTLGSIGFRIVVVVVLEPGEWDRGRLLEKSKLVAERAPRELDFQRGIVLWYLYNNKNLYICIYKVV